MSENDSTHLVFRNASNQKYSLGQRVIFSLDEWCEKSGNVKNYIIEEWRSLGERIPSEVEIQKEVEKVTWDSTEKVLVSAFHGSFEDRFISDLNKKVDAKRSQNENYLFDSVPVGMEWSSFTSFRKWAEKKLPKRFENASQICSLRAEEHLEEYFSSARPREYFNTRNHLDDKNGSTLFSVYLSIGSVDVRNVYNRVRDYEAQHGANKSTYWIIFELLWREFFHWDFMQAPRFYFSENGLGGELKFQKAALDTNQIIKACEQNRFLSASLKQLLEQGFLSNRVRQLFASEWIHDLKRSWLEGARLFERELLDYCPESNYGNWMYIAGVGSDPRGGRRFDLEKQLRTYDPDGTYISRWT